MSFCGAVVILLLLLSPTSASTPHAPKINKNSERKVTSTLAKIPMSEVSIVRREQLSFKNGNNILKKNSHSDTSILHPYHLKEDKTRKPDLQNRDKKSSDNLFTFHKSSKNRETVHMSAEPHGIQNVIKNDYYDKEVANTSQRDTVSRDKERSNDDSDKGSSKQFLLSVDNDTSSHGHSTSHVLQDSSVEFRVALTTYLPEITNVDNSFHAPCNHSCCNVSDTLAVCSKCNLKCVPTDLPKSIYKLLLDNNGISSEVLSAGIFSNYSDLEELCLDSNYITSLPDGVFEGLGHLKILSIYNNNITLDEEFRNSRAFSPLNGSLETLFIHRNTKDHNIKRNLTYPDQALSVLVHLSTLYIDGLRDSEFGVYFEKLTKLTNLSMAGRDSGYCYLDSITNGTFKYLTNLVVLDLSDCNLNGINIQSGVFSPLSRLKILDVSYNRNLGINNVGNFMYGLQNNSHFTHLKMVRIVPRFAPCVIVYKHTLRYFRNSRIQIIEAMENEIEMIEIGALRMLPSTLNILNLTNNRIMYGLYWKDMAALKGLKEIYLDGYLIPVQFPTFFPTGKFNCHYPHEKTWNSEQNYERGCYCGNYICPSERFALPLPPKLNKFTMHSNSLTYNIGKIGFCPQNNLTTVDLSYNVFRELQGPITGLNNIKLLNLTSCFIETIQDEFFDNLTSLEHLNLFQNLLGDRLNSDLEGMIFDSLYSLKYLNLSFNNLYRLNRAAFKNLKNLEILDLSTNRLSHINFSVQHMTKLQTLDIHKNDISSLPKELMNLVDQLLKQNITVKIDMTANPISCDCSNLDFLEWIVRTRVFGNNYTHYYCKYNVVNESAVEMVHGFGDVVTKLKKDCSTHIIMFLVVAGGTLLLIVVITGLLLYRFRWTLRYWFHAAKLKIYSNSHQASKKYDYDVFISYASEDVQFILNELTRELSSKRYLKLMVHGETFQVGRHIADNIYMAVRQCRKTLVLVTKNMLTSHWCTYELQMARQESISTGRDVLVFLFLEEIPAHLISVDVLAYIKTSTYIMYPVDVRHREAFWNKLADDLRA